jgi:hypothetical protein
MLLKVRSLAGLETLVEGLSMLFCPFPTFGHSDNASYLHFYQVPINTFRHTATFSYWAYKNCTAITSTLHMRTFQMLTITHLKEFNHKDWGLCSPNHHL